MPCSTTTGADAELVRDNTPVDPSTGAAGNFASGYHLTADLVDQAIRYLADHVADNAQTPWLTWVALGACHAPHQAPLDLIKKYDALFAHGWDVERERRSPARSELGIVPEGTRTAAAQRHGARLGRRAEATQRLFTRLQAAYAAMLDHADQHLARLVAFLERLGQLDDTLVVLMSDNGASQEGGRSAWSTPCGHFNRLREPISTRRSAHIDEIGGPTPNSNYPLGWAMAGNTPLRRYKQNTHGGGIRDPLVMSWPQGHRARGESAHQFCHASDLAPTLLERRRHRGAGGDQRRRADADRGHELRRAASTRPEGAVEDRRRSTSRCSAIAAWCRTAGRPWRFHPPGTTFDQDKWELYHLDRDFSEIDDLADAASRSGSKAMIDAGGARPRRTRCCRSTTASRRASRDNARRFHGPRKNFVFHAGMGHLPTDVAPDVRNRTYTIEADARIDGAATEGVLIAHGDMTCGYALYVKDNRLTYDMNVGGQHHLAVSDRPVPAGNRRLGVRMRRKEAATSRPC